ncbi:MAG: BNR-4 repeat-containing protein [Chitinophagaceae bacterium]
MINAAWVEGDYFVFALTNKAMNLFFKRIVYFIAVLLLQPGLQAQLQRSDGYKGIWFALGQASAYGDKYSGGLGTYTSSHIPVAIYAAKVQKTFFAYGGTTAANEKHLLIMLSYYDHKTKQVPRPVVVYDKLGVDDPHDNASLSIDDNGNIWVFVSGRNTSRPGLIFKSNQPFAIDGFEQIKTGDMTYPQPWWSRKGFVYLFTRYTNGRELYWSSSSDGRTWQPDQKLAGMGGHYQVSNQWNNKIVSVFNYHPGGNVDKRTNLYLVQTTDMGKTWTNVSGKLLSPPLTDKNSEALVKAYEQEGKLVYINDLNFDKAGNPVVLIVVSKHFQPGPQGDPREWIIAHWKNGQWHFSKVCTSTHNYDMGSLYIENDGWQIIGPTEPGPQLYGTGGEMALWESHNEGLTWTKKKLLTQNSERNHSYARRPLHAHPDFYAFWADGDADRLSASHLYFCTKKGAVYALPYQMNADTATPILIKSK